MYIYLVSLAPGLEPTVFSKKAIGFIKASTKGSAIAQVAKSEDLPVERLIAETKTDIRDNFLWEACWYSYPTFTSVCLSLDCDKELGSNNRSGYCSKHRDRSEHRKKSRRKKI